MNFEFATATRIIFGNGKSANLPQFIREHGESVFLVTGKDLSRIHPIVDSLDESDIAFTRFVVANEPTIELIQEAISQLRQKPSDMVIAVGGGSVIDAGKAISALATNEGDILDYLEVIGQGKPLAQLPLPFIAVPTTAGTGAEVTKNAVLKSEEKQVKVSLRSNHMLPTIALVDPLLTLSLPPDVTASTGMDALTQVLEPFVSHLANPVTDALCREGLQKISGSLLPAFNNGDDREAREKMALGSLLGGICLANAKLGAVHGFAGPIGGMYPAPHGAVCARLLPYVMRANVRAMREREPENPALSKYLEIAQIVTGNRHADIDAGIGWVQDLANTLGISRLSEYGIREDNFDAIVEKSLNSSSMKGNPVQLNSSELREILSLSA